MTIERHSNETQTRWDRGDFKVMIMAESSDRPIGFCGGTEADEAEVHEIASLEGTEIAIDKKLLKTGREVWTIRSVAQI